MGGYTPEAAFFIGALVGGALVALAWAFANARRRRRMFEERLAASQRLRNLPPAHTRPPGSARPARSPLNPTSLQPVPPPGPGPLRPATSPVTTRPPRFTPPGPLPPKPTPQAVPATSLPPSTGQALVAKPDMSAPPPPPPPPPTKPNHASATAPEIVTRTREPSGRSLIDRFARGEAREWRATEIVRARRLFDEGLSLEELAEELRIDQFEVAAHLAERVLLAKARVARDPSAARYGKSYARWELDEMDRWGPGGRSFEQIVHRLERDSLGVAMRMIDRGIGKAGWKASGLEPGEPTGPSAMPSKARRVSSGSRQNQVTPPPTRPAPAVQSRVSSVVPRSDRGAPPPARSMCTRCFSMRSASGECACSS